MRINDRLRANADQGVAPGSRPFGFEHAVTDAGAKTYRVILAEAEAIRWAASRVLAGWSLSSIAAGLRAQGFTGPHRVKVKDAAGEVAVDEHGNAVTRETALTAGSVRRMVALPTVAGHRVHAGVIVGRGNWEAISG